eukprot:2703781-Rhodomonas_salina.1
MQYLFLSAPAKCCHDRISEPKEDTAKNPIGEKPKNVVFKRVLLPSAKFQDLSTVKLISEIRVFYTYCLLLLEGGEGGGEHALG